MNEWFAANKLALNLDKTDIMKFITNNSSQSALCIGYKEKHTEKTVNTTFCGLQIDNHLKWMNHIQQMMPKLSGACYVIRLMVHVSNISTLNRFTMHTFILS
jgi:hypothetical protein